MAFEIRRATMTDTADIVDIQKYVYHADMVESFEIFDHIIAYNMSFVLTCDGKVVGFLLAHPTVPKYAHFLHRHMFIPADGLASNTLFIHDMSILPDYHKCRHGTRLFHAFITEFSGWDVDLISVNGTLGFWQKQGFEPVDGILNDGHYENYGTTDMHFMTRLAAR